MPEGSADEHTAERPYSPYATSKLAFERYLETFWQQYGLDFVALRYANVYGPRQKPHGEAGVVAIFVDRLLSGHSVQVNARDEVGDDGCIRDYVYVGDVARANLAAATSALPNILDVGTGIETTTRQLVNQLAQALDIEAILTAAPPRSGDLKRSLLNPQQYSSLLSEPLDLAEGLRQTVVWAKNRMQ